MAGKGPPPKGRRARPRDEVPALQLARGRPSSPAMPKGTWRPETRAWWKTWASSEQAAHFTATSWQRLTMLLPLVDLYFREPSKELMGEIRLNESKLGATPEDLMRLRWKIEEPPPAPAGGRRYDHVREA